MICFVGKVFFKYLINFVMQTESTAPQIDPGLLQRFQKEFGVAPTMYIRVPGRVNIIGERKRTFLTLHRLLSITEY